jgi:hypothetical protein
LVRSTELSVTTKLSVENENLPIANVLLVAGIFIQFKVIKVNFDFFKPVVVK